MFKELKDKIKHKKIISIENEPHSYQIAVGIYLIKKLGWKSRRYGRERIRYYMHPDIMLHKFYILMKK